LIFVEKKKIFITIHIFSWDSLPVEASNVASESKKHKQQNEISKNDEIIKDKDENEKRDGDKNTDRKKDHEHTKKTTRSPKKKDKETSKEESQVPNLRSRNDNDDDIIKMLTDQILQVNI
jgi:hypothetical protein